MMTLPQWVKPILGDEGTSITDNNIHRWQEWLEPVSDDHPCGEDVAYTDDFEAIFSDNQINADAKDIPDNFILIDTNI